MVFANIEYLFLLLLLIPYIVWYILKQKKSEATLQISDARFVLSLMAIFRVFASRMVRDMYLMSVITMAIQRSTAI